MGKTCDACCVTGDEMKKEVIIGKGQQQQNLEDIRKYSSIQSKKSSQKYASNRQGGGKGQRTPYQLDEKMTTKIRANMHIVVKMQSWARRNKARRNYAYMRKKQIGSAKYFTLAELMETSTLPHASVNNKHQREKREPYQYQSGAIFAGEWLGSVRDGKGTQTWPDGAYYIGEWRDNKACGNGRFQHVDGDLYLGEWQYDKANGFGIYSHSNGGKYIGQWKDDLSHGFGLETWNDNSKYEGMYSYGRKHGFGVYTWKDGSKYIGEWDQNQLSGTGFYEWVDGRSYQGFWSQSNMDGFGTYEWKDGRKYQGEYLDDKKHGYGVFKWYDGRQYSGYWANGHQHGLGVYSKPAEDKTKYGLWEDGKLIQWFNTDKIQEINSLQYDYTSLFKNEVSIQILPQNCTFQESNTFKNQIQHLQTKISQIRKTEQQFKQRGEQFHLKANDLENNSTDQIK